ncbi:MAG: amidohydrolase family protein [Candidatus Thorarchaeota archaeon]|nr:amidohydrolase family protein [Candidatus Thorarchaeota archaeon]
MDNWKYQGPIFDAHTHIEELKNIDRMVRIEDQYGIAGQIGIVHSKDGFEYAKQRYSHRFIFAKYLSLNDIAHFNVDLVIDDINRTKDEGYSLTKTWFGPRWRDYIEDVPRDFRIDDSRLDPVFQALEDNKLPLLIHVADPDTYFRLHYKDASKYGTKEENLIQLENVLERHPKVKFQIPHFGAQPEIHRLSNLSRWLDCFPNVVIDTASSRWICRELSKDVIVARKFLLKYSRRILFGTDLSSNRDGLDYYDGRYRAQRVLWETEERDVPLPFEDDDTKDSGGTFINGLDLPSSVLDRIYWKNAMDLYGSLE